MGRGLTLVVVGLGVEALGAALVAIEVWRPQAPQPTSPDDLRYIVRELCDAIEEPAAVELSELRAKCDTLGLHEAATRSAMWRAQRTFSLWGRIGLVLLALGFLTQAVGTVLGGRT